MRTQRYVTGLSLIAAALFLAWPARGDVLHLVTADRIPGRIVLEARDGVWFEVAPRVALFYSYDRIVRREQWSADRNAALFAKAGPPPPLPPDILKGEVIHETREGLWVQFRPRMARLVEHEVGARLRRASGQGAPGDDARDRRIRDRLAALAGEQPPLTPAQVSHRLGPPDDKRREEDQTEWRYWLAGGDVALVVFRRGLLDYAEIVRERR